MEVGSLQKVAEVNCRQTTCRMAFAFSMIAATFKFLVLALAGDLMAVD
jgi:hypothetical protein